MPNRSAWSASPIETKADLGKHKDKQHPKPPKDKKKKKKSSGRNNNNDEDDQGAAGNAAVA
ncbi:hypothetical protein CRG98_047113 [Punica granatum]|uniref:Uncharacterized protein n=1 Tax=Punica granatum TaxID=22663 RepID=A0A2I0HL96_PUNGR|nr:hypothetical protein CRG98_047113 [Punica granatum]